MYSIVSNLEAATCGSSFFFAYHFAFIVDTKGSVSCASYTF